MLPAVAIVGTRPQRSYAVAKPPVSRQTLIQRVHVAVPMQNRAATSSSVPSASS